jgi:hypothetical protein
MNHPILSKIYLIANTIKELLYTFKRFKNYEENMTKLKKKIVNN